MPVSSTVALEAWSTNAPSPRGTVKPLSASWCQRSALRAFKGGRLLRPGPGNPFSLACSSKSWPLFCYLCCKELGVHSPAVNASCPSRGGLQPRDVALGGFSINVCRMECSDDLGFMIKTSHCHRAAFGSQSTRGSSEQEGWAGWRSVTPGPATTLFQSSFPRPHRFPEGDCVALICNSLGTARPALTSPHTHESAYRVQAGGLGLYCGEASPPWTQAFGCVYHREMTF